MPDDELTVERVVAGGLGLAREPGGRVVLVHGALPGERVRVRVDRRRNDYSEATALEVLDPSPWRRAAPCPWVAAGCGGCGWQHVEAAGQRVLKADIVRDALRRTGRVVDPVVLDGPVLDAFGYRSTVRVTTVEGRPAFRAANSHDRVVVDDCMVAHPLLAELLRHGRLGAADEVTLRCGVATGERLAVIRPGPDGVDLPLDVVVVSAGDPGRAAVHEVVGGHTFRISAASFFQTRPDGAAALAAAVVTALEGAPPGLLVDAYAGVGLFAALVAGDRPVLAVEQARSSVADARHNLAGRDARVVRADVGRWRPEPAAVVVADPARAGLGRRGAEALAATGAHRLVLVSCDPAALGRDTRLLVGHGFELRQATVVDLFPHTPHVEVVSTFDRHG